MHKTSIVLFFFALTLVLQACKYSTPPEMMVGNWYIASVKANNHEVLNEYLDANTRYIVFNEEGTYQVGLLDSLSEKNWMINSDQNELLFMQGTPFNNVKKWEVRAADDVIYLSDKQEHFKVELKRRKQLPKVEIAEQDALIGKWEIDRMTVNGYNSTDKYAFPNRWILLTDEGRFYTGNDQGDQNVGYWKPNNSLTKVNFYNQKDQKKSFISFNIAKNTIWYEKQTDDYDQAKVRIYFKKVN